MDIQNIKLVDIAVIDRKRPINEGTVNDLKQSIKQQGLLQPIGVKPDGNGYRLIFGAHRLSAFDSLGNDEITARVFPPDWSNEQCLLAEIQENLTRSELTAAERKAFAADVGRLWTEMTKKDGDASEDDPSFSWFPSFCKESGLSLSTAKDWWKSFTKETERDITPKQATDADKQAFFDWLADHKRREEEEKARKAAEAEAEKARKAAAQREKKLAQEKADLNKYLDETAHECGIKTVTEWLYQWIESNQ